MEKGLAHREGSGLGPRAQGPLLRPEGADLRAGWPSLDARGSLRWNSSHSARPEGSAAPHLLFHQPRAERTLRLEAFLSGVASWRGPPV